MAGHQSTGLKAYQVQAVLAVSYQQAGVTTATQPWFPQMPEVCAEQNGHNAMMDSMLLTHVAQHSPWSHARPCCWISTEVDARMTSALQVATELTLNW